MNGNRKLDNRSLIDGVGVKGGATRSVTGSVDRRVARRDEEEDGICI